MVRLVLLFLFFFSSFFFLFFFPFVERRPLIFTYTERLWEDCGKNVERLQKKWNSLFLESFHNHFTILSKSFHDWKERRFSQDLKRLWFFLFFSFFFSFSFDSNIFSFFFFLLKIKYIKHYWQRTLTRKKLLVRHSKSLTQISLAYLRDPSLMVGRPKPFLALGKKGIIFYMRWRKTNYSFNLLVHSY